MRPRRGKLARIGAAAVLAVAVAAAIAAPAGAKTKTRTFSSGPINAAIGDASLNLYPLKAKGKGKVKSLTVGVRIGHAFDSDLDLYLVSPRAQFVSRCRSARCRSTAAAGSSLSRRR